MAGISHISAGPDIRWLLWLCWSISLVAFALRVYVRVWMKKMFAWDDRMLLVAMILYTAFCLNSIVTYGWWFRHQPPTFDIISTAVNITNANAEMSLFANIFLRISIALFFARFVIGKWQRRFVFSLVGLNTLIQFAFGWMYLFQCGLPQDMLINELGGVCKDWIWYGPWCYISGAFNGSIDIILAAMPISSVANSKMPRSARIIACVLIALGACGSITEIVRLAYIDGLDQTASLHPALKVVICTIISTASGITAISAATLRPLYDRVVGRKDGAQPKGSVRVVVQRLQDKDASLFASTVDKHDPEKGQVVEVVEGE